MRPVADDTPLPLGSTARTPVAFPHSGRRSGTQKLARERSRYPVRARSSERFEIAAGGHSTESPDRLARGPGRMCRRSMTGAVRVTS
jgi:hypothetical protein